MDRCEVARFVGEGRNGLWRSHAVGRRLTVAPITHEELARSLTVEVPLGARTRLSSGQVALSPAEFTLDSRSGRIEIHYYLPVERRLDHDPRVWYEWKAEVTVQLSQTRQGGFPALTLESYNLPSTELKQIRR